MPLPPDILEVFDREVRRQPGILAPEYQRDFAGGVRRTVGPFPLAAHNWIDFFESSNRSDIGAAIDEQVEFYDSIGYSFRWKIYSHDQSSDFEDVLLDRGFKPGEVCSLMLLDAAEFPLNFPEDAEYRRLTDPDSLAEDLQPICQRVWGDGTAEFVESLRAEMKGMGDSMRIYVADTDGTTAGCGLIRYTEGKKFGGLFAGATVPEKRNRGIYRGMVSARVDDANQHGCPYLYTEASDMSRPILEYLGFEPAATLNNFVHEATS
ncbi:MAG: GNAT family N-acetyltransferase [Verrucomicrobiales bacterium]|nr:GNAT family N-acetyltransferase [Verrucomicrobiales bacterium]